MTKNPTDISGEALMAIELFWKIKKYEKNIEKLEEQLAGWVHLIPESEMGYYIDKTTE